MLDRRKQRLFTPEPAASFGAKTDPTFGPSITTNQLNLEDHAGHLGLQATAEANLIISGWFFLIKIGDLPRMLGATEEEAVMLSPEPHPSVPKLTLLGPKIAGNELNIGSSYTLWLLYCRGLIFYNSL